MGIRQVKTEKITSAQNPKIRELTPLQHRSAYRRETGLFVVEGRREVMRCLEAGYLPRTFFYCPQIIADADLTAILDLVSTAGKKGATDGGTAGRQDPADTESEGQRDSTWRQENVMAVEIPAEIYDKAAYRGGTEGVLAVMHTKEHRLEDLQLEKRHHENLCPGDSSEAAEISGQETNPDFGEISRPGKDIEKENTTAWAPLIVVLEGVEKPGNLGAVLRSADAAGADAVILCDSPSDLYNPNVLRASTGTMFSMSIAECTTAEAIAWLRNRGVKILTAQLQDSEWYYDTDMVNAPEAPAGQDPKAASRNPMETALQGTDENAEQGTGEVKKIGGVAIVMGTEDEGLTDAWREAADAHIKIPMLGRADSLNVSVSAAVLLYEAVRQRRQAGLL